MLSRKGLRVCKLDEVVALVIEDLGQQGITVEAEEVMSVYFDPFQPGWPALDIATRLRHYAGKVILC